MPTVIDSLFYTLGMDLGDYKKGQKEVSDAQKRMREDSTKTTKEMAEGHKKLTEGLTSLKTGLLEVVAIVAAGMGFKDFVLGTMSSQAALGRLSTNLNMNARDLKAWGILAEEAGGKAEDAYGSISSIQQGLGEAMANGHSGFTDMARKMGVGITSDMVKNQDYAGVMRAIATRLQSLPRPLAQYDANQLGVGGMFNILMDKNYLSNLEHAKTLTGVTDESTKAAQRMQKSWVDFTEYMAGVKDRVWIKLEPIIESIGLKFAAWVEKIDWDKLIDKFTTLISKVGSIIDAFGGWKNVALLLGGILALKVLSPVLGLISGLTRLIPLIAGSTLGLWGLAAAAAAAAGYGIGTLAYKAIEGTPAGDATGSFAAQVASAFGSKDATDAILRDMTAGSTQPDRIKALAAVYRSRNGLPRGIRNNNPGNLNYAGQAGAHLESPGGRFAAFDSMAAGIAALQSQLVRYVASGTDTIRKIVNKYAPAGDHNNVAAYIADLMKQTGDGADQKIGANDLPALIKAIINHENGKGYVSDADVTAGLRFGARQRAMARAGNSSSTSTTDVRIASIQVNAPQATDAAGIAQGMRKAMQAHPLLAQADTGAE